MLWKEVLETSDVVSGIGMSAECEICVCCVPMSQICREVPESAIYYRKKQQLQIWQAPKCARDHTLCFPNKRYPPNKCFSIFWCGWYTLDKAKSKLVLQSNHVGMNAYDRGSRHEQFSEASEGQPSHLS